MYPSIFEQVPGFAAAATLGNCSAQRSLVASQWGGNGNGTGNPDSDSRNLSWSYSAYIVVDPRHRQGEKLCDRIPKATPATASPL